MDEAQGTPPQPCPLSEAGLQVQGHGFQLQADSAEHRNDPNTWHRKGRRSLTEEPSRKTAQAGSVSPGIPPSRGGEQGLVLAQNGPQLSY